MAVLKAWSTRRRLNATGASLVTRQTFSSSSDNRSCSHLAILVVYRTYVCSSSDCPADEWCDTGPGNCEDKRVNGAQCNRSKECLSDKCYSNKCVAEVVDDPCMNVKCDDDEYCADGQCFAHIGVTKCTQNDQCVQGSICKAGYCVVGGKLPIGAECESNDQCETGFCDTKLFENSNTNNPDLCSAKKPVGDQCDDNVECASNLCFDFECRGRQACATDANCANGEFCDGDSKTCSPKLDNGDECGSNNECLSGFCDTKIFEFAEAKKISLAISSKQATEDLDVGTGDVQFEDGDVEVGDVGQEDSNTDNPDLCSAKKPIGAGCDDNFECLSNNCFNNECASPNVNSCTIDANCASGEFCNSDTKKCTAKLDDGEECDRNNECESGFCNTNLFENSNTNNPDLCMPKKPVGEQCDDNNDCASNICFDFECTNKIPIGGTCNANSQCRSGMCWNSKCTDKLPIGGSCHANSQCRSGMCWNSKCTDKLPIGGSCHANSQCRSGMCWNSKCTVKLPLGGACDADSDCRSGACSCVTDCCIDLLASGATCSDSCECKSGLYCDVDHDKKCKPLGGLKAHCHTDEDCHSGQCDVFVCAWGLCGTETCVPKNGAVGDYCVRDSHCASARCRGPTGDRECRARTGRRGMFNNFV